MTKPCDLACGPFVDYRNGWAATDYALKASSCKLISSVFMLLDYDNRTPKRTNWDCRCAYRDAVIMRWILAI